MRPQKPRAGAHKVLADLVGQIGAKVHQNERKGMEEASAFLDIEESSLRKLLDPDQGGDVSYARVRRMTEHFAVKAAAEDLARLAGCVLVQIEPATPSKPVWHRSAREIGEDVSNVLGGLMTALEDDGDVDAPEIKRLRLRHLISEAHTALATLDQNLDRIEKGETIPPAGASVVQLAGVAR